MKIFITFVVMVALCATASAAVSTHVLTQDTTVRDSWGGSANNNYGDYASGYACRGTVGTYDDRIMLEFDIAALSGLDITSAQVWMRNRWTIGTNVPVDVARLTQAWAEGTGTGTPSGDGATYNTYDGVNTWTTAGGDYDAGSAIAASVTTARTWFNIDITSLVQFWADNPTQNNGLIIVNTSGGDSNYFDINGSSEQEGLHAAYLVVDSVPEPATMGLLAIGGLALLRRKR